MKNRMAWEKNKGSLFKLESTKSLLVFMAVASIAGCSGADKTGQPTAQSAPEKNTVGETVSETTATTPENQTVEAKSKDPIGADTSYLNFKPSKKNKADSKKDELNANFHFNKANQLREKQQYDEAILEYKRAIRSNPADGAFYKNLGGTFAMVGKFDDAEAVLKKGCEISPDDWLMWNNLAVVKQQLNKKEECKEAIKKSLALKPPKHAVESMNLTLKQLDSSTN